MVIKKDNEFKGEGNSYTTKFKQLDTRLGRLLSVDELDSNSPGWTEYKKGKTPHVLK